jgi:hypothetical protein
VLYFILHARLRAHRAPGIPCALFLERADVSASTRANPVRGIAELCLMILVMPGLDPGIHLLRKNVSRRRWIAGSSPAMTPWLFDLNRWP